MLNPPSLNRHLVQNPLVSPPKTELENVESPLEPSATTERLVRLEIASLEQVDGSK